MKEKFKEHFKPRHVGWAILVVIIAFLAGKSWQHYRICEKVDQAIEEKEYDQAEKMLKKIPYSEAKDTYDYIYYLRSLNNTDDAIKIYYSIRVPSERSETKYAKKLRAAKEEWKPAFEKAFAASVEKSRREREERREIARIQREYEESYVRNRISTYRGSSSGNNSSTKIDEFYDAQDYDDPEDFYLENEDEFYDFEDAEDYWSDYH